MGRVFTWKEYRDNKIPGLESFKQVAKNIRLMLEATKGVVGAIEYGSCMWRTHDARSDVDRVVLYDFDARNSVFRTLREIEAKAQSLHVPVRIIPVSREAAKRGMQDISFLFVQHLERAAHNGGVIKENPVPYFGFSNRDPVAEVREYIRHNLGRLQKKFVGFSSMKEDDQARFLKYVLEVPMHLARKILAMEGVQLENDSKAVVASQYMNIATDEEYALFRAIAEVDARYSQAIRERSSRSLSEHEYAHLLSTVESVAGNAIEFIHLNALCF